MLAPNLTPRKSVQPFASTEFVLYAGWQRVVEALGIPVAELLAKADLPPKIAERGTGQRIKLLRVACANATEIPRSLVEEHLGVPLEKGPTMCMVFSDRDLDRPFKTSNPLTLEMLDHSFEEIFPADGVSRTREVQRWLKRLLPGGRGHLAAVAKELGCSSRQLQRELTAEGTSFTDVLNETRRELALHYLARGRYAPKEVTFLLGYSEPPAFHRAFRQWTGETPTEYSARTRDAASF